MARGIPSSPRRSHRGGPAKSKKKEEEEEDDGGLTRCVCKQQHHEGVMIQCETCKVWQHCPCVGLGDGEVTPDKYYCDSCRPQNHPYRVQNGVLISNNQKKNSQQPPAATSHKQKTTKKRSTMNSKDASMWSDQEHQDHSDSQEINHQSSSTTRGSKRRRKTESTSEEDDHNNDKDTQNADPNGIEHGDDDDDIKGDSNDEGDHSGAKEEAAADHGHDSSKNSTHSGFKRAKSPKTKRISSKQQASESRSSSPSEPSKPVTPTSKSSQPRAGTSKNARPAEDDETLAAGKTTVVPSTKRRKVNAQATPQRDGSSSVEEQNEADHTDNATKSRKTNTGARQNRRNGYASEHEDYVSDSQSAPSKAIDTQKSTQGRAAASHRVSSSNPTTPQTSGKKSFAKKNDRNHRAGSTPLPGESDHTPTPQPLPPAPPAPVRYPSPKMSLQDMNKRAKLLLEYISRVQIDTAERHSRSLTNSPFGATSQAKLESSMDTEKMGCSHTDSHQERTPCSAMDTPLLSTPPQSVHEHPLSDSTEKGSTEVDDIMDSQGAHIQIQTRYRPDSAETESAGDKEPITPPPQGLGLTSDRVHNGRAHGLHGRSESQSPTGSDLALNKARVTSLELMDKLSEDLIRFQARFGQYC
ncbi:hypothetical protein EMPS_07303 [Entomortierella parvispora]|uniref:Zinc finger PHD-type domain-containing protein n=1 Tax=Entomortierella parvispora TaxID=205924 RepID=A0A9P3HEA0_9FUNG|nr:hypothetical protein EMPS_07303 [Entomortierella parvispora]